MALLGRKHCTLNFTFKYAKKTNNAFANGGNLKKHYAK